MALKLVSGKSSLDTVPLILFVAILVLPFLLTVRMYPTTSYFLDSLTTILALTMVIILGIQGQLFMKLPKTSIFFIVLAFLWFLQTLLLPIHFPGQNYFAAGVLLSMAVLSFSVHALVNRFGRQKIFIILATALMIGALLEAGVALLQLLGLAKNLNQYFGQISMNLDNIVLAPAKGIIFGQLGQRNHFAHYLMWGVAATIYLYSIKKINVFFTASISIFLGFFLAISASRTVLLYLLVFIVMSFIWFMRNRNSIETKRMFFMILFTSLIIFAFQNRILLDFLGIQSVETGLGRTTQSSFFFGSRRSYEWYKAWLIFKEHPLLGAGWTQYSVQSFYLDGLPVFDNEPKEPGLFTHSHNSLLQLMSEMGIFYTLFIVIGLIYFAWNYIKEKASTTSLLPLLLISVSLTHSMLEYPLWYVYFLAPFTIFLSLQGKTGADKPLFHENSSPSIPVQTKTTIVTGVSMLLLSSILLVKVMLLLSAYLEINLAYRKKDMESSLPEIQATTLPLIQNNSFLAYESAYTLEIAYATDYRNIANPSDERVSINKQLVEYRPFSYPMIRRAMNLSAKNDPQQAMNVIKATNRYYAGMVPEFVSIFNSKKANIFTDLRLETHQYCLMLKKKNPKLSCPEKQIISSENQSESNILDLSRLGITPNQNSSDKTGEKARSSPSSR